MFKQMCVRKTKAGLPVLLGAPLYFRSGSAHERQWNFLPALQRRLRFRIALESLRSSIKARENEVKRKNFRNDASLEIISRRLVRRIHRAGVVAFARENIQAGSPHANLDGVIILTAVGLLRAEQQ
jgi:hypothetical protein